MIFIPKLWWKEIKWDLNIFFKNIFMEWILCRLVKMLRTSVGFAALQRTTWLLFIPGVLLVGSRMGGQDSTLKARFHSFMSQTHANLLLGGQPEPEKKQNL